MEWARSINPFYRETTHVHGASQIPFQKSMEKQSNTPIAADQFQVSDLKALSSHLEKIGMHKTPYLDQMSNLVAMCAQASNSDPAHVPAMWTCAQRHPNAYTIWCRQHATSGAKIPGRDPLRRSPNSWMVSASSPIVWPTHCMPPKLLNTPRK